MTTVTVTTIEEAKSLIEKRLVLDFPPEELEVTILNQGRVEDFYTDHPVGAAVIHYDGSKFSDSKSTAVVFQDRVFRIAVLLQVRVAQGLSMKDKLIDSIINSVSGMKFKAVSRHNRVRTQDDEYLAPGEKEKAKEYFEHSITVLVPAEFEQLQENI